MVNQNLKNVVAVITGSSRGVGRGIAVALGRHGATVYVTGRSAKAGDSPFPGTVFEAAEEVTAAGGVGIPVVCDFSDDAQIKKLFQQVEREQGKLHILVNNASVIPPELYSPGPFWTKSIDIVALLDVGLRSSYIASYYAAPLLVRGGRGVVVNTSTYGASSYIHGPVYGAQKAGHDKLATDMAIDFREHNVAAVSYWFGAVATERHEMAVANLPPGEGYGGVFKVIEGREFGGHVLAAMYNDSALMQRSGQVIIVAELAQEYGIKDVGDVEPPSYRGVLGFPHVQHPSIIV
ncbi:MAG: family NAD(P)-dependent oxidoreductase [Verrucomicrobiaceae bacterium]|nr:family NAD(P)-dependent oxidoreductase [Verrucomicrobiaceae bacterium]